MKKNILSILALLLAAVSLVFSLMTYRSAGNEKTYYADRLFALTRENEELEGKLDALTAQVERLQTVVSLEEWTLEVEPWADNSGADVTLRAVPTGYTEGVIATFLVTHNGTEAVSIPCVWDGTAFTATAGLTAQDGYGYYCRLGSPGGSQLLSLTTPESPDQDIPVYLASSLGAYCNLMVSDWFVQEEKMVLTEVFAQVQVPRISASGQVELDKAELVLSLNGADLIRKPIELDPSEVEGSFDATLAEVELNMPELEETDTLDLNLVVTLSDGTRLTAYGASWYLEDGALSSVVG